MWDDGSFGGAGSHKQPPLQRPLFCRPNGLIVGGGHFRVVGEEDTLGSWWLTLRGCGCLSSLRTRNGPPWGWLPGPVQEDGVHEPCFTDPPPLLSSSRAETRRCGKS